MKKRILSVLIVSLILVLFPGTCFAKAPEKKTVYGFNMDTIITLTAYVDDDSVLDGALRECARYDNLFSRTIKGSDVWNINHAEGKPVEVSQETIEILETAQQVSRLSDGAFDITIAPASTLWDFTSEDAKLPDANELKAAAEKVDYTKIKIQDNTVTLPKGMMIDLGGIAKGYVADAVKAWLADHGVEHAILSFGGSNIACIGLKPDDSSWKIGIQDIDLPSGAYMLVSLNNGGSTVTSGIYERGFDLNGVRYHHLLDSKTGWPVQNELASVTIFSDSSMWGDALSTAAFVLGTEEGTKLIESLDGTEAMFIARDRSISYTSGAKAYIQD